MSDQPTPRPALSRRRLWLFRLIACGVPTIAGLSLIVLILFRQERLVWDRTAKNSYTAPIRFQDPTKYLAEPGHGRTGHKYLYDEVLGWRNIPNWSATTFDRPLNINSKGLRDLEYSYEKPANTSRILVLGDSFAWGYGVGDDEIFSEVLEMRLAKQRQHAWDVINGGVSGWGTDQEYLFLMNEGFKYSPDIVVLAFFLYNDPTNNSSAVQYYLRKPVFLNTDLELANVPVPKRGDRQPEIKVDADPLELTVAIIAKMLEECQSREAQLVVAKFGLFLDPTLAETDREFKQQMDTLDLLYLDLDQAYTDRSITTEQLLVGNNDGHWNAFGHRQTAVILHEFLAEAGLVPAATEGQ